MKIVNHRGREWQIAESANEVIDSFFNGKRHTADCYIVRRYKNRVDLKCGGLAFSVNIHGVFCFRSKNGLWYFCTESFFGEGSPWLEWGLSEAFRDALIQREVKPVCATL